MQEPTVCPQCNDRDAGFTPFENDETSARDVPGKRCENCQFAMYEYSSGWEW